MKSLKEYIAEVSQLPQPGDVLTIEFDSITVQTVISECSDHGLTVAVALPTWYLLESFCEDANAMIGTEVTDSTSPIHGTNHRDIDVDEAKYHGREVTLNQPMRGDVKKSKVFVRDPKTGNIRKINFGDKTMRIKKSSPKHRKSFRARHHCENPGPKTSARYWACRSW